MGMSVSVDSKALTLTLSSLDATLKKNTGGVGLLWLTRPSSSSFPRLRTGEGPRSIIDLQQRQLAARGHDVSSARVAHKRRHAAIHQDPPEFFNSLRRGFAVGKFSRIPRDQIHFPAFSRLHRPHHPPPISPHIVPPPEPPH